MSAPGNDIARPIRRIVGNEGGDPHERHAAKGHLSLHGADRRRAKTGSRRIAAVLPDRLIPQQNEEIGREFLLRRDLRLLDHGAEQFRSLLAWRGDSEIADAGDDGAPTGQLHQGPRQSGIERADVPGGVVDEFVVRRTDPVLRRPRVDPAQSLVDRRVDEETRPGARYPRAQAIGLHQPQHLIGAVAAEGRVDDFLAKACRGGVLLGKRVGVVEAIAEGVGVADEDDRGRIRGGSPLGAAKSITVDRVTGIVDHPAQTAQAHLGADPGPRRVTQQGVADGEGLGFALDHYPWKEKHRDLGVHRRENRQQGGGQPRRARFALTGPSQAERDQAKAEGEENGAGRERRGSK